LTRRSKGEGVGLVPHAHGFLPESGVLTTEEMLLGSFVEAAAAPAGMGESFVEAA